LRSTVVEPAGTAFNSPAFTRAGRIPAASMTAINSAIPFSPRENRFIDAIPHLMKEREVSKPIELIVL
jgi:hypothetical protein